MHCSLSQARLLLRACGWCAQEALRGELLVRVEALEAEAAQAREQLAEAEAANAELQVRARPVARFPVLHGYLTAQFSVRITVCLSSGAAHERHTRGTALAVSAQRAAPRNVSCALLVNPLYLLCRHAPLFNPAELRFLLWSLTMPQSPTPQSAARCAFTVDHKLLLCCLRSVARCTRDLRGWV